MKAYTYTVTKNGWLPYIGCWVYKDDEITINKSIHRNILAVSSDNLMFKEETEISPSLSFTIKKPTELKIVPVDDVKESFMDNIPNKSMLNKRKKVRTK